MNTATMTPINFFVHQKLQQFGSDCAARARVIAKLLIESVGNDFLLIQFGIERKDDSESPFTAAVRTGVAKSAVDAVRQAATVFKPVSGRSWTAIADWVIGYEKIERRKRGYGMFRHSASRL
jgi:hypothetical protein